MEASLVLVAINGVTNSDDDRDRHCDDEEATEDKKRDHQNQRLVFMMARPRSGRLPI